MKLYLTNSKAKIVLDALGDAMGGFEDARTYDDKAYYAAVQALHDEIRSLLRQSDQPDTNGKTLLDTWGRHHTCAVSDVSGRYRVVLRRTSPDEHGGTPETLLDCTFGASRKLLAFQIAHDMMTALEDLD